MNESHTDKNLLFDENNNNKTNKNFKKGNKKLSVNILPQNPFVRYFKERQKFYESIKN